MTAAKAPVALADSRISATLALDEPIARVAGVSAARAKLFGKLGVTTVRDLVMHFPRRYMDLTAVATAASAPIGSTCTIFGRVHEIKLKRPRYNLPIVEIALVDATGMIVVSAFRQPWLKEKIKAGDALMVAGRIEFNYGFKRMTNPHIELAESKSAQPRIIPVHPATGKLTPAVIRMVEEVALDAVAGLLDPLPLALRAKRDLCARGPALRTMHFPESMAELPCARKRLVYEELLFLQLFMMQESQLRAQGACPRAHVVDGAKLRLLEGALPFTLTSEQVAAKDAVLASLAAPKIANHMVLGDVGTGKTVIAAFGLAAVADTGSQGVMLAPTEVLARQHGSTLGKLFDQAGVSHALLTGSTPKQDRADILARFASGALDVLIGTHALLEDDVRPHDLTFVVIDEQQRFGVNQRAKMLAKGAAPDALYLTATPIPRTLALTLFGDLTLSYIKERPHAGAGRRTTVLPHGQRGHAYDAAKRALEEGHQAFVVCPLIGVSAEERDEAASKRDGHGESGEAYHPVVAIENDDDFALGDVAAAEQHAAFLQKKVFVDTEVGLLHGGLTADEKTDVMRRFAAGEIGVLVATTVIEVGVDVPNATVMIVEDADRFGLSQLHQLRGRVGRGEADAEVYFVSASQKEPALKRLAVLERSDDGFEIAEYDLSLRREGDILGNRQSGTSALKLVNIVRDRALIEAAHEDAEAILAADPALELSDHAALAREVRMIYKGEHAKIGG